MRDKAGTIGNIVGPKVPISQTEDDNAVIKTWHPDGPNAQVEKKTVGNTNGDGLQLDVPH